MRKIIVGDWAGADAILAIRLVDARFVWIERKRDGGEERIPEPRIKGPARAGGGDTGIATIRTASGPDMAKIIRVGLSGSGSHGW